MAKGKIAGDAPYLAHCLPDFDYLSCWSSPEALAGYINSKSPREAWHGTGWSGDERFTGTKSMAEAVELARKGWPEGAERVSRIRDYVSAANPIRKNPVRYGIAGTVPSVPRAVAGDPKSMRLPSDSASKKHPIITLVVNMSANWSITTEKLGNRSAAVAAVIDQVEEAGFCVEVVAIATAAEDYTYRKDKREYTGFLAGTSVLIKSSDQPSDVGRLAFGLGHASMFRRFTFADWGSEPTARKIGDCLGYPYPFEATEDQNWKCIFVLPPAQERSDLFEDEKTAASHGVQFILNHLRKQKCPAFPGDEVPIPEKGKTKGLLEF